MAFMYGFDLFFADIQTYARDRMSLCLDIQDMEFIARDIWSGLHEVIQFTYCLTRIHQRIYGLRPTAPGYAVHIIGIHHRIQALCR